jgi:hypothetical protein
LVSRGFDADGADAFVEVVDDALVEAIELGLVFGLQAGIGADGTEKASG